LGTEGVLLQNPIRPKSFVVRDAVLGHPVAGSSGEGFVMEQLTNAVPDTQASFYRTSNGAEVDLVLTFPDQTTWAIEIKRSSAPTLSRGLYQAATDVGAARKLLVAPVENSYPTKEGVEVDVMTAARWLSESYSQANPMFGRFI
jgi:predicted AAA+ superfamily ATPase